MLWPLAQTTVYNVALAKKYFLLVAFGLKRLNTPVLDYGS